jgi:hypothetical protein
MLTDDDLITDLARLRERSARIEYAGEVPLTRRSAAATVAPVAALAAVATVGAAVVTGSDDGRGTAPDRAPSISANTSTTSPDAVGSSEPAVKLVDATITLAGRTIAYQHAVGKDPFAAGWQLAIVFGDSLPPGATRFTATDGSDMWVADAPGSEGLKSVLIVLSGPDGITGEPQYVGMASRFTRAALEDWVRTELGGQ